MQIMQTTPSWTDQLSYARSEVVHIPNFWKEAAALRNRLDHVFREVVRRQGFPRLRLFVGQGLRNDLAIDLMQHPPHDYERFEQWISRVIGTDNFCLSLNDASSYDELFAELVAKHVTQPASERMGTLIGGYEAYVFAGQYDSTPFGIHEDVDHSVLLHLGPNPQKVLIWPRAEYEQRFGSEALGTIAFDVAAKAPFARMLNFCENDLLLIPKGDFHVFMRPTYSVTLGLIPHPSSVEKLLTRALAEHLRDWPQAGCDASYLQGSDQQIPQEVSKHLDDDGELKLPVRQAIQDLDRRLRSNGHLVPPPPIYSVPSSIAPYTLLRCRPQYPLYWRTEGDVVRVFARGRTLKFKRVPGFEALIARVATSEPFTPDVLATVAGSVWSPSVAVQVVDTLWAHGALELA